MAVLFALANDLKYSVTIQDVLCNPQREGDISLPFLWALLIVDLFIESLIDFSIKHERTGKMPSQFSGTQSDSSDVLFWLTNSQNSKDISTMT